MIPEKAVQRCEQLNVNDATYKVAEVFLSNGQLVKKGDIVLSLDSSKASYEVHSDIEGVFYTTHALGDTVRVNQGLFLALDQYSSELEDHYRRALQPIVESNQPMQPSGGQKTVTAKAQKLLNAHGLSVDLFPQDLITEKVVNDFVLSTSRRSARDAVVVQGANTNTFKRIAVIGGGKAFIQVLDCMQGSSMYPVCIYDDEVSKHGQTIYGVPVRGGVDSASIRADLDSNLFDAVVISVSGSIHFRKAVYEKLRGAGIPFASLVHRSAYLGIETKIGDGNVILANVSVGPCAEIGDNNFISAQCNIEHHNILGSHCTFGPGVMTSGSVTIEDEVKFGTGVFVEPRLVVGTQTVVSSGSIVTKNLPPKTVVFAKSSELTFKPRVE